MTSLIHDIRYTVRGFLKTPGFVIVAIVTLALGVGATTAVFTLINAVMLRKLPVRAPEQLVELLSRYPGEPPINGFSWRAYEHYRDENHSFSDVIGVSISRFHVSAGGNDAGGPVDGGYVPGNFFQALGVQAAAGRLIEPADDRLGDAAAAVAVLSWPYWQTRFDLDRAVVGRRITIDGVPATVIGVASPGFGGLETGFRTDVWVPAAMEPLVRRPSQRADGRLGMKLMARLKPGVSIEQARAEMDVLDRWRVDDVTSRSKDPLLRQLKIDVQPAAKGFSTLRDYFGRPLVALMAIVGLLLLLTCSNIASMMLARVAARERERAVRVALGARRLQIARLCLTESMLVAGAGSACGVLVAYAGAGELVRIVASARQMTLVPQYLSVDVRPDLTVLLFALGASLLTGLLVGLAPAWSAVTSVPASSLRSIGRAGQTEGVRMLGKGLVVVQVALSIVLLSTAGLFVRHLSNLRNVGLGFDRSSVLLVTLDLSRSGYQPAQRMQLYRQMLGRLEAIPAVRSATVSGVTPIHGAGASRFVNVEGVQEESQARRYVSLNWVGPHYFETFGTPLVAGRDFEVADEGRPRVAIINAAMARHYFGTGNPIGRHFSFDGQTSRYEIVGVVGDAKYLSLHETPPRTIYLNAFQDARTMVSAVSLRTAVTPMSAVAEVRRVVRDMAGDAALTKVTTLTDQVDASIVPERLSAMLSGMFGGLGATLAAIGLYGLLAFTVARRVNEIGVRMAIGASQGDVMRMVLESSLGLVAAGLAAGIPFAFWTNRVAANLLGNVPSDSVVPTVFASMAMIAAAFIASYLPARRAARVDPLVALRSE